MTNPALFDDDPLVLCALPAPVGLGVALAIWDALGWCHCELLILVQVEFTGFVVPDVTMSSSRKYSSPDGVSWTKVSVEPANEEKPDEGGAGG